MRAEPTAATWIAIASLTAAPDDLAAPLGGCQHLAKQTGVSGVVFYQEERLRDADDVAGLSGESDLNCRPGLTFAVLLSAAR